jgi:ribonuclease VapC
MIIDTSAMIAILRKEAEAERFRLAIDADMHPKMSVVSYVEAGVVLDANHDPVLSRKLDDAIRLSGIEVLPVTVAQGFAAREAYRDFGKGSGHPARLNFGDCFAYALAKERDEPLLFKGTDFSATDVEQAHRIR